MNKYSTYYGKEKTVKAGESKIFSDWKRLVPTLTEDEFLVNLRWVCEDMCENGDGTGRLTREIGLTVKLSATTLSFGLSSVVTIVLIRFFSIVSLSIV